MIRVEHGDCLEVIPQLVAEGVLVDAIVTDPPYHLTSGNISVDWGAFGPTKNPKAGKFDPTTGLFVRSTGTNAAGRGHKAGFMGKAWDGGDVAFRPETWAAIGAALKPGGYLLAFGGSRTHHRIWSAIEDAGFVIQDTIMWLYGSGFPKGRTQLKPSHEPICVAYKPGGKRELQIDECRAPVNGEDMGDPSRFDGQKKNTSAGWLRPHHFNDQLMADRTAAAFSRALSNGRWPANVCHDGSDEVMEAFAAFGASKNRDHARINNVGIFGKASGFTGVGYEDAGTPARFYYAAKASKADRAGSKHPTIKPIALMRWLVRLVTQPGGTVLDAFAGSGTTGAAAVAEGRNAILIEREDEYIGDIRRRLSISRGEGGHSMVAKRLDRQEVRGTLL